jgi:hypothetical protein
MGSVPGRNGCTPVREDREERGGTLMIEREMIDRGLAIGRVANLLETWNPEKRWDMGGKWDKANAIVDLVLTSTAPRCDAVCHTGPGHQSTFRCELRGEHEEHRSLEGGWLLEWEEDGEMVD